MANIFSEEREEQQVGAVEPDIFVINDIVLRISPEQIHINKSAYNHKWQTLRTASSRKLKSGHSIARVSLDLVFQGDDINTKLNPLIAGLRSTPFASVHNAYLENKLMDNEVASGVDSTSGFKTLVLALSNAVISTAGHENLADCLKVQLYFIWFNYYPYTPIWAYKTDGTYDKPGYAYQSDIWKKFYQPFIGEVVDFPHSIDDVFKTDFMWREYKLVSVADASAHTAAIDLLETLLEHPDDIINKARLILAQGDNPQLSSSFLDTLTKNVLREKTGSYPDGKVPSIQATETVVGPIFQRILATSRKDADLAAKQARTTEKDNILQAISLLKQRQRTRLAAEDSGYNEEVNTDDYKRIQTLEAKYHASGGDVKVGELVLLGKKSYFSIDPNVPENKRSVIEQITVSFSNILATIPMSGYTYPTCQHIGSIDVDVSFVMNLTNNDADLISQMYNSVEQNALKFKQVPAGFLNLSITSDVLRIFNLEEFITVNLQTDTIPNMPGRSRVVLQLTDAGITSKTKLRDPERITQEYIQSDISLAKNVWDIMANNIKPIGAGVMRMKNPQTLNLTTIDIHIKNTEKSAYKCDVQGVAPTTNNVGYIKLCAQAADNYNNWLDSVHNKVFDSPTQEGAKYFLALQSLTTDKDFGFIPGLDKMIDGVIKRDKALIEQRGNRDKTVTSLKSLPEGDLKQQKTYAQAQKKYGDPETATKNKEVVQGIITLRKLKLADMGLNKYLLKQSQLLRDIQASHIDLDQFKKLAQKKKDIGIGKGVFAYPDFEIQLESVASLLGSKVSNGILLDMDPDIYMWYPVFNGNANQDSMIDPEVIETAKRLSIKSFETAQGNVSDYFAKIYVERLKSGARAPYEKLKLNSGLQLAQPFYNMKSYDCSTNTEDIKKQLLIDPQEKTHINIPTKDAQLKTSNSCTHTTDFNALWGGVSQGANVSPATQSKDISGINKHGNNNNTISPSVKSGTKSGKGVEPGYKVNWDSMSDADPSLSVNGLYCPLQNYNKLQTSGSVAMRDIGMSPSGDSWKYRPKASLRDWPELHSLGDPQKIKGWRNPNEVELFYHKSITKITYEEYMDWKVKKGLATSSVKNGKKIYKNTGSGVGYLHKGVDVWCKFGTSTYAISDGIVVECQYFQGAGLTVSIKHNNSNIGLSRYLHLQDIHPNIKRGSSVRGGQLIAVAGHSGGAMGVHLHFETWVSQSYTSANRKLLDPTKPTTGIPWNKKEYNNLTRYKPPKKIQEKLVAQAATIPSNDVTTLISSPMNKSIQEFEAELLRGQGQSLMRAYPTFKLYFIEDDKGEIRRLAYDDFFSYNAVKSIRVVRSRKIAADLCEIFLTNVSGVLSNRKFSQEYNSEKPRDASGKIVKETTDPSKAGTKDENPIASLLLQEGMNISLRLGFSSDPDRLDTVFNGIITEIEFSENEDLVRFLAQSYAVELVQDIKGVEKPQEKKSFGLFGWDVWGLKDKASTGRILEEIISEPEVLHFGRWEPHQPGTAQRDLLTTKWQFQPNPSDDNIFAPPFSDDLGLSPGIIIDTLKYTIYRTTIWDICKEMEMRHPNFIASVVPYKDLNGERMTFFFGLPNQLYFARHPSAEETNKQDRLKALQESLSTQIAANTGMPGMIKRTENQLATSAVKNAGGVISFMSRLSFGKHTGDAMVAAGKAALLNDASVQVVKKGYDKYMKDSGVAAQNLVDKSIRQSRMQEAMQAGFIKPFRNYHLITSRSHIVSNNIRANARDVANTIIIKYAEFKESKEDKGGPTITVDEKSFTLKLDNGLPTEEIKAQIGTFINVTSEELAKRYALSLLLENLKDIYKGDIVIIGNPSIKPHDILFVLDEYSDMIGPVVVEEVQHVFSQEEGFLTIIKPDMLVCAAEWSLLSSAEAMGMIMEGLVQSEPLSNHFSPMANLIGRGIGRFGGFLSQKLISYTQLAQPIIMCPLMVHGRIFTGGVSTRKLPGSVWESIFGDWSATADVGFSDWLEDKKDEWIETIKGGLGLHSVGSFFSNDDK